MLMFLDAEYARHKFPRAVAALPRRADELLLVHFDGFLHLIDEDRHGYARAYWMPINEIWAPCLRRIA